MMNFLSQLFSKCKTLLRGNPAHWRLAGVILFLALGLRCVGIRHGAPRWIYHPDVTKQAYVARDAFKKDHAPAINRYKDNAYDALYPYGDSVLLSDSLRVMQPVLSVCHLSRESLGKMHHWQWAFMLRILAVTLMGLALFLFIAYAWPGAPWLAILPASLLLAFEPLNAQYSHYGMNDVPLTALLMMIWLGAPLMKKDRMPYAWRSLLLGGLLGIAFGVKYQAIIAAVIPGVVWLMCWKEKTVAWRLFTPVTVGVGFFAGALYACPPLRIPSYFIEHFPEFMAWQANIMGEPIPLTVKVSRNLHLLSDYLFLKGYVLLTVPWILFFLQLRKGRFSQRTVMMGVSGAAFSVSLLLIFLVTRDFLRSNDMLALIPFWIWPTGWLFCYFNAKDSSRMMRMSAWGMTCLLCLLSLVWITQSCRDSLALRRTDTREYARHWAIDHLKPGDKGLYELYTVRCKNEGTLEYRSAFITQDSYWGRVKAFEFDYLFSSSLADDRFYDPDSPYYSEVMQERYQWITEHYVPIAQFEDRELYFAHPRVTIYSAPR